MTNTKTGFIIQWYIVKQNNKFGSQILVEAKLYKNDNNLDILWIERNKNYTIFG